MASLATFGHLLMLQAFRRTPLALLTPFGYAQLAFATLFSWALFGKVPDIWTAVGMLVIAISGIGTYCSMPAYGFGETPDTPAIGQIRSLAATRAYGFGI